MPALDTDTVILSSSIITIAFGLVLPFYAMPARVLRLHWAAAVMLYGVAGLLIGFRALLPPWLANVIANMMVGGSVVVLHRSVWVMLGRKPPDSLYMAAVAGLGVAYYVLTYPMPHVGTRLFIVSAFRVPFFLSAAAALFPYRREGGAAQVLMWLLSVWSGWYALRAGLALSSNELAVMVRTGPLQGANFLIATTGLLLIGASHLRMASERTLRSTESHADELRLDRDALEAIVRERTVELQAAKDEAERANRGKSQFLAAASHDLRQPLQALRLFLDVLAVRLKGTADERVVENAVAALTSSERLLHALLDISRLDAGVVPVRHEPVRMREVVDNLMVEMGASAAQKGIALRAVACDVQVHTDRQLLERALRNLLHNALRYTAEGRILVGCRRLGDKVRVEVWDTGPGIPEAKMGLIFDDFTQLGNPERDQSKGLGLGLAILRRISQLLGWEITVKSRLGRGSVFAITMPAKAPSPGEG